MKNAEAVFLVAAILSNVAAFATADVPASRHTAPAITVQAVEPAMQVVEVKAKRLTAAEKAALK